MLKKTRLYSILNNQCPRCHKGDFFVTNNPYDLKRFSHMHKQCAICGENFERETGFYYGAMYASYGLTVAFGVGLFLLLVLLLKLSVWVFLISFSVGLILLLPVIYRLSRLLWINIFVGPRKIKN